MSKEVLKRAKTARGRRHLKKYVPQVYEQEKMVCMLKNTNTSLKTTEVQAAFMKLLNTNSIKLAKSRKIYPFEDATLLEDCAQKTSCSIFMYASHSKKRPNNITFARTYDDRLLDLVEVGIIDFVPMSDFKSDKIAYGQKPLLLFTGSEFMYGDEMICYKDILLDMFHRNPQTDLYDLKSIDSVISFTALNSKQVDMRVYRILLNKCTSKIPRVELEETGPRIKTEIRRIRFANRKVMKVQSILTEHEKKANPKNVTRSATGDKIGKVYPQTQDIYKLQVRKVGALKRKRLMKESLE